jgi:predicted nucleic acid-binding protein
VEARAALARRHRSRALSAGEYRSVVRELDVDWPRYLAIEPGEAVRSEAVRLAAAHALRGYDALHLASAVTLRRQLDDDGVAFASWNDELDAAAGREGFDVLRTRQR